MRHRCSLIVAGFLGLYPIANAEEKPDLATKLREVPTRVLPEGKAWPEMLSRAARAEIDAANARASGRRHAMESRADWEQDRNSKLVWLRDSLGTFPERPARLDVNETGKITGDGYVIDNIVFESRPGLVATANIYRPATPKEGAPGIVICHSHHNPKTQGELQHMGIGWARQGAVVIVPDMLGHGERRQHPFDSEEAYAGKFRVGRQDYYFRYNVALQLHLVGESLVGWIVNDLMRCVDVLLQRYQVDAEKVALLGSVAGGGDPAAVAAALDPRIKVAVIFNFGGPQPESTYPLPADAETSFNYAGCGSWESTRNLQRSARNGFLPWVIVGSIAPRKLVYAHEFSWDRDHDPVWKRLTRIYDWYGAPDNLAA